MKTIKQIIFTKPYVAEYQEISETDFSDIAPNQVVVKTMVSSISAGTERANYVGDENVTIVKDMKVGFPRVVGYSSAGEVVKVGSAVTKVRVKDRVACFGSHHVNYNVLNEDNLVKIESDKISYEEAAISYISCFPLAAVRKVRVELGESLMVMGLGLLGQLAVAFARSMGAYPVIACDPVEERRNEALKNGADYAFDPFDADFIEKVKSVSGGGVNTAIEVTGVGVALDQTLDCMKKFGRIALLGCTRKSDFSIDFYHKVHGPGITLIGAHTSARPNKESYPAYFTHEDDIKTFLNLTLGKRINVKNIIKASYSPKDCQEVYTRLVNDKNFPICAQFKWENE